MPRAKIFLFVAVIVGGLALLWLLLPRSPTASVTPLATASAITLYGYAEGGALSWETRARAAQIIDKEGTLSQVTIRFTSPEARQLTVTSDQLVLSEGEGALSGSVCVEREDGLRLRTDALTWDEREQTLSAGSILLELRNVVIEGERFLYNLDTQHASLMEDVHATIDGATPLHVCGERAEESAGTFAIVGNVGIESDQEMYRCHRLESDATGDVVRLIGSVEARFVDGSLSAEFAQIRTEGLSASGGVSVQLELSSMRDV
jgi:LPS export ABC transporter protein LptC